MEKNVKFDIREHKNTLRNKYKQIRREMPEAVKKKPRRYDTFAAAVSFGV